MQGEAHTAGLHCASPGRAHFAAFFVQNAALQGIGRMPAEEPPSSSNTHPSDLRGGRLWRRLCRCHVECVACPHANHLQRTGML